MHPWWTDQQAALVGGIGGSIIGGLGGLFGAIAGICAPRGKWKGFVFAMTYTFIAAGWTLLAFGLIALMSHQPYGVWYPLLLGGGLLAVVMTPLALVVHIRYREAENRRLEAEQLRRG